MMTESPERPVAVVLLSGDTFHFARGELLRVMTHRYVLPHYLLIVAFVTLLDNRLAVVRLSVPDRLQIGLAGSLSALCAIALALVLIERFSLRGGGVRIHATHILLAATLTGVPVGNFVSILKSAGEEITLGRTLVLWAFYYVVAEIVAHLMLYFVFPRALRDMRKRNPKSEPDEPEPSGSDRDDFVQIGAHRIAACELRRITAEGNYVIVETARERRFLPGPFGKLVDTLPERHGLRVGRSDWVSRAAVVAVRDNGRDLVLVLQSGAEIAVARARRRPVESWLRAAGLLD